MADAKLTDFQPDPKNLNQGSERGNYALERSLRDYGFARPVVAAADGTILAGNHAYAKAGEIGLKKVRVVETDGSEIIVHKRTDLDAGSAKARMVALVDNRTSQLNYVVDEAGLHEFAQSIPEVSNFFNEDELARFADASVLEELNAFTGDFSSDDDDSEPTGRQFSADGDEEEYEEDGQSFYGFSVSLTHDQREVVFKAIMQAKRDHNLETSAEAIAHICAEFVQ